MSKTLKIILISIVSIVVCYAVYIGIEVYRFNNNVGCHPLLQTGSAVYITANSNTKKEKYIGLGYTIEYEMMSNQKENSDIVLNKLLSGKMKLFGKIRISEWIS